MSSRERQQEAAACVETKLSNNTVDQQAIRSSSTKPEQLASLRRSVSTLLTPGAATRA